MADLGDELGIERFYRSFSAGATLYYAGAPADEVYLVREGRARLVRNCLLYTSPSPRDLN